MPVQVKDVSVIGSGVGGLAIAIRLAASGHKVTVFEKNSTPGGKLSHFKLGNYCFDAGPSLFTQPENIVDLFNLCSKDISAYFEYKPVELACRYFFEQGVVINGYTDKKKFAEEMENKVFESAENILSYLENAEKSYDNIGALFLNNSLHKVRTWLTNLTLKAISVTKLSYLIQDLNAYNESKFKTNEAVQIFNRFATYNGSNPYKAPAMLSMIPHLEHNQGTYYPKGGMISITNALYTLAKDLGVDFLFETNVDEILKKGSKVVGVRSGDKVFESDIVVSNMDVFYTYRNLLGDSKVAKRIEKQERSSSAVIFYWGIKSGFKELDLHNIFFSKDYKAEFDSIFNKKQIFHDPTIYINVTSKQEEGHAPDGGENWFVMVNTPNHTGQDWSQLRMECRQAVISKLNRVLNTDLHELIEVEEYLDPEIIDSRTYSYTGSLYGTSSNSKIAAFLRHPNFSYSIDGLYFVGGSVHPGGGIPLCLKSAKIVSKLINN